MKLEIKLKNPEYCENCPLFKIRGYKTDKDKVIEPYTPVKWHCEYYGDIVDTILRPSKCIQQNGI